MLIFFSVFAGFTGSLLGLGGGVILIPALTLIYKVPIHQAIAISLVSIVANSVTSTPIFIKSELTNIRIGLFLVLATITGALGGVYLSEITPPPFLFILFGFFLLFSAYLMITQISTKRTATGHPFSQLMGFDATTNTAKELSYKVDQPFHALFWMLISGLLASLLGIGGGVLKVLAMDYYMKLPLKVSSATSNFMIGITATAASASYLVQGKINYEIVAPVVLGIVLGAFLGAKVLLKISEQKVRKFFVLVLVFISIQMIRRGFA